MAAFLFSDIEGSTKLLERLGDDYLSLLAGYRECLDTAIAAAGGETVDTEGGRPLRLVPHRVVGLAGGGWLPNAALMPGRGRRGFR